MMEMDSPEMQALLDDNSVFMDLVFDSLAEATQNGDAETGEIVGVIVRDTKPEDVARFYRIALVYAVKAIHQEAMRIANQQNPLEKLMEEAGLGDLFKSLGL